MDHAPLYFLLSVAYCICAGLLGAALWASSPWVQNLVYWWAAVLTCLGTALLLYDPFGRDTAGRLTIALEAMGVVIFIVVIGFGPRRPTEHEVGV